MKPGQLFIQAVIRILLTLAIAVSSVSLIHLSAQPESGKSLMINGAEIYYVEIGTGSPLLLLHFFGGCGEVWRPFIPELSKHYRLIIPDMRGHGRSSDIVGFTHKQSALDMYALLDTLGIENVKAIGMSSGGMTLIHMATQQPDRISEMVLVGATIYFPEEARTLVEQTTPENLSSAELEQWGACSFQGEAQTTAILWRFNAFKDSYDDMNFTAPYLSTIKAKTLIIHGDRDEYFPVNIPVEMYEAIPDAYLWIIPYGSHLPVFGASAELFTKEALNFLTGNLHHR